MTATASQSEKGRIHDLYARRARDYDWSVPLWRLGGFREAAYRRDLAASLGLRPGDTVVDLGCGTGRNFPFLEAEVGPSGTLLGTDFSGPMLERARQRAERGGWSNLSLVEADAAELDFPESV
ncbi:MAG TPA: methyltransferase domain-containing protein, partial [Gammaproteobacteria bacterium]|nr:methyltransferase domain-containing protein [Gammaproteobacteria bacterium]